MALIRVVTPIVDENNPTTLSHSSPLNVCYFYFLHQVLSVQTKAQVAPIALGQRVFIWAPNRETKPGGC